jgi:hypothetical protein
MELLRWSMAERFGWTLAEVDALSMGDLHEFLQIEDARAKAAPKHSSQPRRARRRR